MPKQRLTYLLAQYINGDSSPEEEDELFRLIQTPGEETDIREWLSEYIAAPKELVPLSDETTAAMFKFVTSHQPVHSRRRRKIRRWAVAASITVLAVSIVSFFIYRQSGPAPHPALAREIKDDILPGKNGAVLTLSNGKQLVLDSLPNGLINAGNESAVHLKEGGLIYEEVTNAVKQVEYNTLSTPNGRQFQIQLPDGTRAWLNAASSIRYPTMFNDPVREVFVTGEVYFEVAKKEGKPFIVRLNDESAIEVLGTHFNINAYGNEKQIRTTLLEGKVKVLHGRLTTLLKPGQQARYPQTGVSDSRGITVMSDADINQVMAWKNGVFDFNHASLDELMRQLARWYDIEVIFEEDIPEMEFRGKMGRDVSLSKVLFFLEGSDVHFRFEKELKRLVVIK
jgi:transmembrane sensor